MITITAKELFEIAKNKHITVWTADRCTQCDYPIKFFFHSETNVRHDPGCTCIDVEDIRNRNQASSWQLVADWINQQTDLDKIKEIKNFWGI